MALAFVGVAPLRINENEGRCAAQHRFEPRLAETEPCSCWGCIGIFLYVGAEASNGPIPQAEDFRRILGTTHVQFSLLNKLPKSSQARLDEAWTQQGPGQCARPHGILPDVLLLAASWAAGF